MELLNKSERLGTALGLATVIGISSTIAADAVVQEDTPIKIPAGAAHIATMSGSEGHTTLIETTSAEQREEVDCGSTGGLVKTKASKQIIGRFVLCTNYGSSSRPAIVTIEK